MLEALADSWNVRRGNSRAEQTERVLCSETEIDEARQKKQGKGREAGRPFYYRDAGEPRGTGRTIVQRRWWRGFGESWL